MIEFFSADFIYRKYKYQKRPKIKYTIKIFIIYCYIYQLYTDIKTYKQLQGIKRFTYEFTSLVQSQ